MAIPYIISQRINSIAVNKPNIYFIKLIQNQTIGLDQLCKEIEKESALSEVEIYGVLLALQSKIIQHLENGNAIDLQFLGKFSVAAKTKAQENIEDVSAKDVQKFHINFHPSTKIKQWLKQDLKLKKRKNK